MDLIVTFQKFDGYLAYLVPTDYDEDMHGMWGHFTYIDADGSVLSGIRWVDSIQMVEIAAQK